MTIVIWQKNENKGEVYTKVDQIITTKDGATILRMEGGNFKIVKSKRISITI